MHLLAAPLRVTNVASGGWCRDHFNLAVVPKMHVSVTEEIRATVVRTAIGLATAAQLAAREQNAPLGDNVPPEWVHGEEYVGVVMREPAALRCLS
ncbi:hypothetical protein AX769_20745 (plasmid) [Frondihabitans sp. PAMC 28766]|nr:hypothetical protein AX769_20745 [Frondihabitans sp. PAMC 28766]